MPNKVLIEKRKEYDAKRAIVANVFKEAGSDRDFSKVTAIKGTSEEIVASLQKMNKELEDLGGEIKKLADIEYIAEENEKREKEAEGMKGFYPESVDNDDLESPYGAKTRKSLGERFTELEVFKSMSKNGYKMRHEFDVPMKTLMTTAAGWAPESLRTGEVVPYARRPPTVYDLFPKGNTASASVKYMEQTTRTNNAAEKAEGSSTYGEAAIVYTERSAPIEDIGVFIPVTGQQLEDEPMIQGIINDELGQMLIERIDSQGINGSGSTPSLQGILAKTGILTYATSGSKFDTIFNAGKDIRVTGRANPNACILHPNDWAKIRLIKTEDGLYILGNPNDPNVNSLWGLSVVENTALAETYGIVGDFTARQIMFYTKRGVVLEISDSHDTYFVVGKYAIRATIRGALVIKKPEAFCKITGL